ncbi:hypothetical protein L4C34_05235 [Vibrio profundum]|uniref:hypothetical protein n=1 Tax=Vibrio profundum TaxID=2910247 RepID=UPI003D10D55C
MKENVHGISYLSVEGHILYQVAEGSWNLPMAKEYGEEVRALVENTLPSYWVLFVDLRKWEHCPPDVWQYFDELYLWFAENGMIAEGIVSNQKMINHFVTKLDDGAGHPTQYGQFFSSDYDETLQWCQRQVEGYETQST